MTNRDELIAFAEAFSAELEQARVVSREKDATSVLETFANPGASMIEVRALTFVIVSRLCKLDRQRATDQSDAASLAEDLKAELRKRDERIGELERRVRELEREHDMDGTVQS